MHPALIRYAATPRRRFLRPFLLGIAIGCAALFGGLAAAEQFAPATSTSVSVPAGPPRDVVVVSAGPDRRFGTADDIRTDE